MALNTFLCVNTVYSHTLFYEVSGSRGWQVFLEALALRPPCDTCMQMSSGQLETTG